MGTNTLALALTAALFACARSWSLVASPSSVVRGFTANVTLRCFTNSSQNGEYQNIYQILIKKRDDDGKWHLFAMKRAGVEAVSPKGSGVSVNGLVDKPENSYLNVAWATALEGTVGAYSCHFVVIDLDFNFVTIAGKTANITAKSASLDDVIAAALDNKKRTAEVSDSFKRVNAAEKDIEKNERLLNETREKARDELTGLKSDIDSHNSTFYDRFRELKQTIKTYIHDQVNSKLGARYYESRTWPEGRMAIPAPESGCPANSSVDHWVEGAITIDRSAGLFHPNFSAGNHLLKPLSSGPGNIQLRFCTKTSHSGGRDWPKGSYCVADVGDSCPLHFDINLIRFESLTSDPKYVFRMTKFNAPGVTFYSNIHLWLLYCCRNDGSADHPMFLPTKRPFYLYTYEGQCQRVLNADVTKETMTLATNFDQLKVDYANGRIAGKLNKQLDLCYYTPRTVTTPSSKN